MDLIPAISSANSALALLGKVTDLDLPGKSGEIFCRLVHLSHLGFECDGRFVAQS